MAHSKQFSDRPPEAILDELGSVKDLLNRFDDNIEDILSRRPQPDIDIPLLSDVVPDPDGEAAASGPAPVTAAHEHLKAAPPATDRLAVLAAPAPDDEPGDEPGDDPVDEPADAPGDVPPIVDLTSADIEELEQLVFSDDGPSLPGAGQSRAAPPATGGTAPLGALELLPHLVDDVIDAHIPRLKAELLTRLRALIEHADEQRRKA